MMQALQEVQAQQANSAQVQRNAGLSTQVATPAISSGNQVQENA